MLIDSFRIAIRNLLRRKLRSWLTVIGVFIGIMAVVTLISLSQGMEDALLEEFRKLGTNKILVTPGGAEMGPMGGLLSAAEFSEEDFDAVKNTRGVKNSFSVYSETAYITFARETKQEFVWGITVDSEMIEFFKTDSAFELEEGRNLRQGDKYKVAVGYGIAHDLFDKDIAVGKKIMINDFPFEVVGVYSKKGGVVGDNVIRIPKETAREIFDEPDKVTAIFIEARQDFSVNDVAERVKKNLRKFRNVKEGEEDFSVQTTENVIKTFEAVLGVVQAVLVGIALISLLVGGVGIMNTMYTSVVERTREIGIMKSIGARNSNIMFIFLIESGLLGLIGGIIGVLLGISLSKSVEVAAFQFGIESLKAYTGLPLLAGAALFAFLIGSVSGVLPALQASKLNPVDALRK
jgi:putative ABC transport system permease protein